MAPPTLHPINLPGPWSEGFVLERQHTLSSTLIGHDSNGNPQFDTKRSELGQLVYRLKNRSDRKALGPSRRQDSDAHMTMVFIAGSRKLSRLSPEVKARIDTIIEKGFTILVGDANGADKAVQRYLADNGYRDVVVHCMASNCRNNVGNWPTHESQAPRGARGFEYYATKDQAMVDAADYGLMLWDGESKGTLNSVLKMVRLAKPVVVYFAPNKIFQTLRSADDATQLLMKCEQSAMHRLERELGLEPVVPNVPRGA